MSSDHCSLAYEDYSEPNENQKEEKGFQPELNLFVNPRYAYGETSQEIISVKGNISLSF